MENIGLLSRIKQVRKASKNLAISSDDVRRDVLGTIARALEDNKDFLFAQNKKDLDLALENGIKESLYHRLVFSDDKLSSVTKGLKELQNLPDPIGKAKEKRELDDNFILEKRTYPCANCWISA